MKEHFSGYYRPSDEQFSALWKTAQFVLDANVLLNLYAYSPPAQNGLLALLILVRDRLWVPHQAAAEFHRNRPQVIAAHAKSYEDARKSIHTLSKGFTEPRNHPFLSDTLSENVKRVFDELQQELANKCDQIRRFPGRDPLLDQLSALLSGRVGEPYDKNELQQIQKEAASRYEQKIPPGWKDAAKGGPEQYGDFVIWRQTLDRAKSTGQDVIFVTDDAKEDWWWMQDGLTLGPLPALREEFAASTEQSFYMYSFVKFAELAGESVKEPVNVDVLKELQGQQEAKRQQKWGTFEERMRRAPTCISLSRDATGWTSHESNSCSTQSHSARPARRYCGSRRSRSALSGPSALSGRPNT